MDQPTVTPSTEESTDPAFDRRRGPRRGGEAADVQSERRNGPDRRKKKPGLAGLFGAIFGIGKNEDPES